MMQVISAKRKLDALPAYAFPVAALLTGVMSGLFGIGGGLLLNPVLLQIGVPPTVRSKQSMSASWTPGPINWGDSPFLNSEF